MTLAWSFADLDRDQNEFAQFSCWDGSPATPWVQEVELYIRHWLLGRVDFTLCFRSEDDELIGVAAFSERNIFVPIVEPVSNPGWHLELVAVRLEDQGKRLSGKLFRGVFEAMEQIDDERVLYTAFVHKDNAASIEASARVGLELLYPKDDHYLVLLGEVPTASNLEEE